MIVLASSGPALPLPAWMLNFTLAIFVQSTIVIAAGLILAGWFRRRDVATGSLILRATVIASIFCPLVLCLARRSDGWAMQFRLPLQATGALLLGAIVAFLWITIAMAMLLRIMTALRALRRLRREARSASYQWIEDAGRCARAIGMAAPSVLQTDRVVSPCLTGYKRPSILLPTGRREARHDILLHEMAHVRRHDCLWHLLAYVATAMLWFQPLMWMLTRRLISTADDACDDFVLAYGSSRSDYARVLIDLAEQHKGKWQGRGLAVGMVHWKSTLSRRVVNIMDTSRDVVIDVRRVWAAAGTLLLAAVMFLASMVATNISIAADPAPPAPARAPIPDNAAQSKTEKVIRDVFGNYAAAPLGNRPAMAAKMLEQGMATADDPVARYVLLKDAAELSASAGDATTAMRAASTMGGLYAVDEGDLKLSLLRRSVIAATTPNVASAVASEGLTCANEAAAAGNYDQAGRFMQSAEQAARASKDVTLILSVQSRAADIKWLQQETARAKTAQEKLAKTPADPEANHELGRYFCLVRGDWKHGLMGLSLGSNPAWQAAAKADLTNPTASDKQVAAGDLWWDVAEKEPAGIAQRGLRRRAGYWYAQAAANPQFSGLKRSLVEKRLAQMPPPGPGEAVAEVPPAVAAPALPPPAVPPPAAEPPVVTPLPAVAAATLVNLVVVNDESGIGVTVYLNGKVIAGKKSSHWGRKFQFDLNPNDSVVFKTATKRRQGVSFCLYDQNGNVISYSRANTAIHPDGDGSDEFLLGKSGIPGVVVPGMKETKTKESMEEPSFPRKMPLDWDAIWFADIHQNPIFVRVYPVAQGAGSPAPAHQPSAVAPPPAGGNIFTDAPPPAAVAGAIDLLSRVNLETDVVAGKWTRGADGLVSPDGKSAGRIRLPYNPPAEYDLRVAFTLHREHGAIGILFAHNDASGMWFINYPNDCRFRGTGDLAHPLPEKIVMLEPKLAIGARHEAIIKVRNNSISTFIDGKPMSQLTEDYSQCRLEQFWSMGNHAIGISGGDASVTFHAIEAHDVSGAGAAALAPTYVPPPGGNIFTDGPAPAASNDAQAFARQRNALPQAQRLSATLAKLKEINGGGDIRADIKPQGDGTLHVDITNQDALVSITPLYGLRVSRLNLDSCKNLKSLDGVQGMPLTELNLTNCFALEGDLSALKGMRLTKLCLRDCKSLKNINGIQGMPLTELNMWNCFALEGDLSALHGMRLTHIDLGNCPHLESLSGIQGMPLTQLDLTNCSALTGDLSALRGMQLTRLSMWACKHIESLDGIQGMPLKELTLTDCYALGGDLAALKGMPLTMVNLWQCQKITSLDGLEGAPLTELVLTRPLGKKYAASILQMFPALKTVDMGDQKITDDVMAEIKKRKGAAAPPAAPVPAPGYVPPPGGSTFTDAPAPAGGDAPANQPWSPLPSGGTPTALAIVDVPKGETETEYVDFLAKADKRARIHERAIAIVTPEGDGVLKGPGPKNIETNYYAFYLRSDEKQKAELVLRTSPYGTLTVYLDGSQIHQYSADNHNPYEAKIPLPLSPGNHVVVIRHSNSWAKNWLGVQFNGNKLQTSENIFTDGPASSATPAPAYVPPAGGNIFTDAPAAPVTAQNFARERNALPADQQIAATLAKLNEVNGGHDMKAEIRTNADETLRVNLVNQDGLESIEPLYGLKVTKLNIYSCRNLQSLIGIQGMPLTDLSVTYCPALQGDLSVLKGMRLTQLNLTGCQSLRSLNGIQGMPVTGELSLAFCSGLQGDLSALAGMRLTKVELQTCQGLNSLHGIEGMPLTELNLNNMVGLDDLLPLKGMPLTKIVLSNCRKLKDLSGLEGAPLKHLELPKQLGQVNPKTILDAFPTIEVVMTGDPKTDSEIAAEIKARR